MKGISLSNRAVSLSLSLAPAEAEAAIFFLFVTQHCRLTAAAESPFHYYWAGESLFLDPIVSQRAR